MSSDLSEPQHRCFVEAEGLLMQLQKYEFVVCLTVFEKLLSIVHVAHKLLQSKGSTLATASNLVNNTLLTLEEMRCSDKARQDIWQGVNELLPSEVCHCEPAMDRDVTRLGLAPPPKGRRSPLKLERYSVFLARLFWTSCCCRLIEEVLFVGQQHVINKWILNETTQWH